MADVIERIQSSSSGTIGRAHTTARGARLVLDSSSRAQADAFTNSEAFLAGVSSCGVTLIEMHARDTGIPVTRMEVTIEGVRAASEPTQFAGVTMTFAIAGVTQEQAEALVETYRGR